MMRKVVLNRKTKIQTTAGKVEPAITGTNANGQAPEASTADQVLVGTQTDMPNQKGRVVKMFFPKLSLPSPYPILTDKSRIDSSKRARKLASPDKQITIINNRRINGVKYSVGFIEKRKAAAKPPKKKFDFDF